MRCPSCGAANPESAQWCGQCLRRFDEEPADHAAHPPPSESEAGASAEAPPSTAAFRREGDDVQWACSACGQFNSIELSSCAVCGTAFVDRFRSDDPEPPRNWPQALLLSMIVPGAGHLAVGRYGSGLSRVLLFATWALGAVMLLGGTGRQAGVAVMPLVLGAFVLWIGSLVDIYRLQRGEEELLVGRRLLWLVVGVLLLLVLGLFASVGGVNR